MKSRHDNIGHSAHFGGAIGGFAFTLIKYPIIISEMPFIVLMLALPIVILFILRKTGKM
jgi:hypothetical protein